MVYRLALWDGGTACGRRDARGAASPAEASSDPLTVSGTITADETVAPLSQYAFDISLVNTRTGREVSVHSLTPSFSISAPTAGSHRLSVSPAYTAYETQFPWATSWWYGGTANRNQAQIIALDGVTAASPVSIRLPNSGRITGTLTYAAAPSALSQNSFTAEAILIDPSTGRPSFGWHNYGWGHGGVAASDGSYTISGLPPGRYFVRFSHDMQWDHIAYTPRYFRDAHLLPDATAFDVAEGQSLSGVNGSLALWNFDINRVAGTDRYATAVALAQRFAPGVPAVYLASGENWPDALSAAPAAAHRGGPLLLTASSDLPASTEAELARLKPGEVVVADGPAAVSDQVIAHLTADGFAVRRVAGADRYETSRRLVSDAFADGFLPDVGWLATGRAFPDALSAANAAALGNGPVILIDGQSSGLDTATDNLITSLGISIVQVAGGTAAVSAGYFDSLVNKYGVNVERVGGANRYETSALIAQNVFAWWPAQDGEAHLASGTNFPDALAAAPLAGLTGSQLYLTPSTCVPASDLDGMKRRSDVQVHIVGGTAALSPALEELATC